MKVLHIITGLGHGGAEMMLYKLLTAIDHQSFESEVLSLTDLGPIGEKILARGIPVRALGMRRGIPDPLRMLRLVRWVGRSRPHVIQTWMYHANLLGGIAGRVAGGIPVVWGIHHSNLSPGVNKRSTLWTVKASAGVARGLAASIVCCSSASFDSHLSIGFPGDMMSVIPNGFDLSDFVADPVARHSVRSELGLPPDSRLIGLVGRFHPLKDHHNFVAAAARFHRNMPDVHFVMCGDDVTPMNRQLMGWIEEAGLASQIHLLGRREDIARLTAAFDLATLSSIGEAFPNVVGEAMACEVPCVVTDVGDSAAIVGDTGLVVPSARPDELAGAWLQMLSLTPLALRRKGEAARSRIQQHYALPVVTRQYELVYKKLSTANRRT